MNILVGDTAVSSNPVFATTVITVDVIFTVFGNIVCVFNYATSPIATAITVTTTPTLGANAINVSAIIINPAATTADWTAIVTI